MRCVFLIFLFSSCTIAQYNYEASTEQSYENQEMFFKSNFLNTFGLYTFKNLSTGLINEPFLNQYLNPASLPQLKDKSYIIYMDFRGDRTESSDDNRVIPLYGEIIRSSSYYPPYYYQYTDNYKTPEPILSFGIISSPFVSLKDKFFIGGTYQVINKNGPYYYSPYSIYYPNPSVDPFGNYKTGAESFSMYDSYYGINELTTEAQLYSLFSSYELSDKLSAGIFFNGVVYSKSGKNVSNYNNEYGIGSTSITKNSNSLEKNQDYHHNDIALGTMYKAAERLSIGMKIGYLSGKSEQSFESVNKNFYKNNTINSGTEWSYNDYKSIQSQSWIHDGSSQYISLNFLQQLENDNFLRGYYRFTYTNEEIKNKSYIYDSSYYNSRYEYTYGSQTEWYLYEGNSLLNDLRRGTGTLKSFNHELMFNVNWKISAKATIIAGIYYGNKKSETNTTEPVNVDRISNSTSSNRVNPTPVTKNITQIEDKVLNWTYRIKEWSFQIPIILQLDFEKEWGLLIGINRNLSGYNKENITIANFNRKYRNEDGVIKDEKKFSEKYVEPLQKYSDNKFDFIFGGNLCIAQTVKLNLMLDPELEPDIRIAQWWLALTITL